MTKSVDSRGTLEQGEPLTNYHSYGSDPNAGEPDIAFGNSEWTPSPGESYADYEKRRQQETQAIIRRTLENGFCTPQEAFEQFLDTEEEHDDDDANDRMWIVAGAAFAIGATGCLLLAWWLY